MNLWVNIGIILVCISLATYALLFIFYRRVLVGYSTRETFMLLISRIPDADSPTWPHVLAGVLMCLGICLLTGATVAGMAFVAADFNRHSTALTAGGLVFGVLVSVISFLTLGITKKIEQAQGSNVDSFRDLIRKMEVDLKAVNHDFLSNSMRVRDHHRVFLVTTNPFLGKLSFPTDPVSHQFSDALRFCAENVKASADGSGGSFQFEVLCGDQAAIREFHQVFYRKRGGELADPNDPQVVKACEEAERLISEINAAAAREVIHRVRRVPRTQFAVVGNVVYEFILETPGFHSEVHRARRIGERIVCDRFLDTFAILKDLAGVGNAQEGVSVHVQSFSDTRSSGAID